MKSFLRNSLGKRLLSTRKLQQNQKELLLNAGFGVVEADFIHIDPIPFFLGSTPQNLIFTSTNAVKAVLHDALLPNLKECRTFCVGNKTREYLLSQGFSVTTTADYGIDLAHKIANYHPHEEFLFLCGRRRNSRLSEYLNQHGTFVRDVEVYDTRITPKRVNGPFQGVLFFSPSGVESYCSENDIAQSIAFCIGKTTAARAAHHTGSIVVANSPSVENVIVAVVQYFKNLQEDLQQKNRK